MKVLCILLVVVGAAVSREVGKVARREEGYECPPREESFSYMSFCAWDPCNMFADQPCADIPEAVCKFDACENHDCIPMFFVDKKWVECEDLVYYDE
ncbi:uncharacterized protein LOC124255645 [Haliotis rubra]|uniref:uncharacterized protein LOC124255645 n=1 Tax=Haliotis rubra TaxID=36100 RepID=UPI001EE60BFB|nr:uncharacterized protein LOC124255645 [Haliotis rubra]